MTRFRRYPAVFLLAAGTALASPPASAAGIAGDALRFDGGEDPVINGDDLGDFVNIPHDHSLSLQNLTLEAWVIIESGFEFRRRVVLSKGREFGNYTLAVGGLGFVEYVHQTDQGNFSCCNLGDKVPFDEWTHVAATFDAVTGVATTYVNGQLAGQASTANLPLTNFEDLFLGRADFAVGQGVISDLHLGLMDEVRIWNVARTPEQIAAHFNRVVGPNTPGLVANYHFDEGFDEFEDPVQEVFDSAAKPDDVDPNDGTLGADADVDLVEEPQRVDSTAPLVGDVAECPVEQTSSVCVSGTEDNVVIFYGSEPAFNVGPARCTCSEQVTVEECSPDASGPNPCFPENNEVFSATVLDVVTTDSNPRCKRVCYDADGTRVCEKVCKKKKKK